LPFWTGVYRQSEIAALDQARANYCGHDEERCRLARVGFWPVRCHCDVMTSPALLQSYRNVREVLGDIQQMATAIDEHLGRFQIYDAQEELRRAIAQADGLAAKVDELGSQLRRCAPMTSNPPEDAKQPPRSIAGSVAYSRPAVLTNPRATSYSGIRAWAAFLLLRTAR
jgi:hypothetical protein